MPDTLDFRMIFKVFHKLQCVVIDELVALRIPFDVRNEHFGISDVERSAFEGVTGNRVTQFRGQG